MTEQVEDAVRHLNKEWVLYASTDALYDVESLGLKFGFAGTHCWRGHRLVYELRDDTLVLEELHAAVAANPVTLFGVAPTAGPDAFLPTAYLGLGQRLSYTGGIVLANSPLLPALMRSELFEFRDVLEVTIERGMVTSIVDRSSEVRQLRDEMTSRETAYGPGWRLERLPDDLAGAVRGQFYWRYYEPLFARLLEIRSWTHE